MSPHSYPMALASIQVIQDLAVVLAVALGVALTFHYLKQPPLIGFIIAGIIVGPYTPPFGLLTQPEILNVVAEIGLVFLLFAIGLEFPIAKLRALGRKALVIALTEALGTFALGTVVGETLGLGLVNSLFIGLAISVTSTVLLNRTLEDLGVLKSSETALVLGITVIEDVIVVSVLATLQTVTLTGVSLAAIGLSLLVVAIFLAVVLLVGPRVIPRLVDAVARTGRQELLLIVIVALAFGFSVISNLIGVSVATGAFLAGVLVAESKSQAEAVHLMVPLKSLFGAIFFVSIGALMNIDLIPEYLVPILAFLVVAYVGKLLLVYLTARREGVPEKASRRAGLSLAPSGGELSLAIAKGGEDIGATSAFVLPIVGAITIVTTFTRPYILRYVWGDRFRAEPGEAAPAVTSE